MSDDFGFWEVFWSVAWFMLWVAWIWVIIAIIRDIFSDSSLGGGAKALWTIFVILIPWLGVLVYLFSRGDSMNQRVQEAARDNRTSPHDPSSLPPYVLGKPSVADELKGLAELRDSGTITTEEYEQAKAKILAS